MTGGPALSPDAAIGWLRSMSVDVRAAAVLDAAGAVLAGDGALAGVAGGGASPSADDVMVARSPAHTIVVRGGPCAIEGLLRADLHAALEALGAP
jgi:hypothetical protein